jgi:hypothetical protein
MGCRARLMWREHSFSRSPAILPFAAENGEPLGVERIGRIAFCCS